MHLLHENIYYSLETGQQCIFNPGTNAQRGLQYLTRECDRLSACPSVCLLPHCDNAQRDNKTAIPTLHWLHFKKR